MKSLDGSSKLESSEEALNALYNQLLTEEESARDCYVQAYEWLKEMGEHNQKAHDLLRQIAGKLKELDYLNRKE